MIFDATTPTLALKTLKSLAECRSLANYAKYYDAESCCTD
jgi:hypothetical protein